MKYFHSTPIDNYNFSFSNIFNQNLKYQSNFYFNDDNKIRPEINSIIGIGDCIVDIITEINENIIAQYKFEKGKTKYVNENNRNIFDEYDKMSFVRYVVGGSIQNILKSLSFSLYQNPYINNFNNNSNNINIIENYKISMLGCVGADIYKEKIINSLSQSRIGPILEITNGETSRCAAGFYNKKPYLISDIKSSKKLDKEFIISNKDKILNHKILLIEGYYIQYQFEICKELCELFQKEQNKLIILILNNIELNQYLGEKFVIISNYADIIFSSLSQVEEFTNLKGGIEKQKIFEKLFQKLSDNKKRLLVIKDGKDESYCASYDYTRKHLEYILTCFPQKIKSEEIIDEIGVEDAFFGGFLAGYMKGFSLYTCLKKGNDVANITLKNMGCTFETKK